MAVDSSKLKDSLIDAFSSYPDTVAEAASDIAAAYHSYAGDATFGTSVPTLTSAQKTALEGTILTALQGKTLAGFCNALQSGLVTYWTGVAVAGGSGSGTTTPPTGNIVPTLQAGLAAFPETVEDAADIIATQLDILSKTTTASLTIPPASPVVYPLT